jgi:hypothetical protein
VIVIVFTLAIAHLLCISPVTSYEFVRQAPIAATQGDSAGSTDASGIPVKLELLDKIRAYRSGTIDNLRLRVFRPARVNEFTILEEGTEAIDVLSMAFGLYYTFASDAPPCREILAHLVSLPVAVQRIPHSPNPGGTKIPSSDKSLLFCCFFLQPLNLLQVIRAVG